MLYTKPASIACGLNSSFTRNIMPYSKSSKYAHHAHYKSHYPALPSLIASHGLAGLAYAVHLAEVANRRCCNVVLTSPLSLRQQTWGVWGGLQSECPVKLTFNPFYSTDSILLRRIPNFDPSTVKLSMTPMKGPLLSLNQTCFEAMFVFGESRTSCAPITVKFSICCLSLKGKNIIASSYQPSDDGTIGRSRRRVTLLCNR